MKNRTFKNYKNDDIKSAIADKAQTISRLEQELYRLKSQQNYYWVRHDDAVKIASLDYRGEWSFFGDEYTEMDSQGNVKILQGPLEPPK